MNHTLGEYITELLAELNEERNTPNYPDAFIKTAINRARQHVWDGTVRIYGRRELVRAIFPYPWQLGKAYLKSYAPRYLATTIASTGQTTLNFDATGLPASGSIVINGDRITYTGNSGVNGVTGVSGIQYTWEAGTPILFTTPLPADYSGPIGVSDKNGQKIKLSTGKEQSDCACSFVDTGIGYTSYPVSSASIASASIQDGYFIGVSGTDGDPMVLEYRKTCIALANDADIDAIPDGLYFIPQLALAYIYIHRGEENRGQNLHDTIATNDVASFYKAERNKIRPRQWGEDIIYS